MILFPFMSLIYIVLGFLMAKQESERREISFKRALLFAIFLSPLIAYVIITSKPLRPGFEE